MSSSKSGQISGSGRFGMGSEREYSLKITMRDADSDCLVEESFVIDRMIQVLAEKRGATSFNMKRSVFPEQELETLFSNQNLGPEEKELIKRAIIREALAPGIYLDNFGRIYEEGLGKYFECSTVPCRSPFELLKRIRQGEQIAGFAARSASTEAYAIACFNAGSDRRGHRSKSAGHHDNFWTRKENSRQIYQESDGHGLELSSRGYDFASWLVLRIIFTGAGKIFFEPHASGKAYYEISERASFIDHLIGMDTAGNRPLLNTRNEPHCNEARAHQINNDGNRSPWSILLNLGLTALVLDALAHEGLILSWRLRDPVKTLHNLSKDLLFSKEIPIILKKSGAEESRKPLELLFNILRSLERYAKISPLDPWCTLILGNALELAERMKRGDYRKASRMLDWLIKAKFLADYKKRRLKLNPDDPKSWDHDKIREIELNYHRLDDERIWIKIAEHCRVRDFEKYLAPYGDPSNSSFWENGTPVDTRSYLFSWLLHKQEFQHKIAVDDWEYLIYRENINSKQIRVEIADLFRFNREHLETILREGFNLAVPEGRTQFMERLKEEGKPYAPSLYDRALEKETEEIKLRTPYEARYSTLERRAEIAKRNRLLLPMVSVTIDDYEEGVRWIEIPISNQTAIDEEKGSAREPEDLYERSMGNLEQLNPLEDQNPS